MEHGADGRLRVRAGMQDVHLTLRPGETIRSPRILQLFWSRDGRDDPISADDLGVVAYQVVLAEGAPTTCFA